MSDNQATQSTLEMAWPSQATLECFLVCAMGGETGLNGAGAAFRNRYMLSEATSASDFEADHPLIVALNSAGEEEAAEAEAKKAWCNLLATLSPSLSGDAEKKQQLALSLGDCLRAVKADAMDADEGERMRRVTNSRPTRIFEILQRCLSEVYGRTSEFVVQGGKEFHERYKQRIWKWSHPNTVDFDPTEESIATISRHIGKHRETIGVTFAAQMSLDDRVSLLETATTQLNAGSQTAQSTVANLLLGGRHGLPAGETPFFTAEFRSENTRKTGSSSSHQQCSQASTG
jgi:hypothetical protein